MICDGLHNLNEVLAVNCINVLLHVCVKLVLLAQHTCSLSNFLMD